MSKNKKKKNQQTKVASNLADVKKEQATVEAEANLQQTVVPTQNEQLEAKENSTQAQAQPKDAEKGKNKAVEVKAKDVDKKKKKDKTKKPSKVAKALKDTGSELKKVTWPKFGEVVKQTGIVLVVVIVFALVLLGLDKLCSLLVGLLN